MNKIIKTLLITVFCLCFCLNTDAKMSKEANKLYTEALQFENNNQIEGAIDLIEKALNNSKDDLTLTVKLAGLYARKGDLEMP